MILLAGGISFIKQRNVFKPDDTISACVEDVITGFVGVFQVSGIGSLNVF